MPLSLLSLATSSRERELYYSTTYEVVIVISIVVLITEVLRITQHT